MRPVPAVAWSPDGVADGHDPVARPHAVGVVELERAQIELVGRDAQDGDVGLLVLADHLRRDDLAVGETDLHVGHAAHDVRVGDDATVLVEHEARPGRHAQLAARVGLKAASGWTEGR